MMDKSLEGECDPSEHVDRFAGIDHEEGGIIMVPVHQCGGHVIIGIQEIEGVEEELGFLVPQGPIGTFRFYDLRHTFASRPAMTGANDRTLQTLMGHKSQRMILRYAHLGLTHLWNALEGLVKVPPARIATDTKEILTID